MQSLPVLSGCFLVMIFHLSGFFSLSDSDAASRLSLIYLRIIKADSINITFFFRQTGIYDGSRREAVLQKCGCVTSCLTLASILRVHDIFSVQSAEFNFSNAAKQFNCCMLFVIMTVLSVSRVCETLSRKRGYINI